jgi:hypothetical protein
MDPVRTIFGTLLIILTLGCAHAAPVDSNQTDLRNRTERCALPLLNTQEVVVAILRDLSQFYTAVDGTIIKVEHVNTGKYEVWVSHNERIDVLAFDATASPACEVTVQHTGEHSIGRRAPDPE